MLGTKLFLEDSLAAMPFCQLEISDNPVYVVWLDPESLLQMEGCNRHASRSHGTFVEAYEKRADALHAARQNTCTILSEPFFWI